MPPPRPPADTRKPYHGPSRSLVIAIDIGTTFSGVSYAILEPGEIPKIHGVTRFPGQEHVAGNTKIPSIIYYDKHGKMMAAGAEADTGGTQAKAEDEGWIKAELFKLRLRPRTMQLNMNGMRLGPLPKRKTAVHVFGDFLAYLYRCTRNFITDTHANGAVLWNQVESDIQFVLSHPNGWEGAQQSKMRRAAIYGGLIPETNEGKARIRFVTEGEASLHACVLNGLAADVLSNPSKHGFLIADAGGGTLDISAYAIKGASPLVIEEIAPPDCIFAGSVFVSRRAREFLEVKLRNSKYGTSDALDHITRRFDETTKRLFRDKRDLQFVPFGSPLDKDSTVGIRGGQLKLTGQEVADLFEPSVDAAFKAIKAQIEASQGVIKSVFLVGGYAASPWLFGQLQERLAPYKITVSRPDTQTSKAVADGAIGFYCDHHVSARMSKFMYGVEFLREMDPRDPDHVARKERLCELPSGPKLLPDAFDCILSRGVKVKESNVFTRKYCTELTSLSMLSVFEVEIWCYRGGNTIPKWINRQADNFSTLCVVRADLSPLAGSAEPKAGKNGKTYWTIVFSVEIQFGLTEFKARIKWVDNGMTKYGPASIIYNERGHRADEDEPDVFPEDEANTASATTTPRSANRSEPVSRARTPVAERQPSIPPSTTSSRRPSQSYPHSELSYASGTGGIIPEVARVERDISRSGSRASHSQASPSMSSRNGHLVNGDYESDRRTVSSSKSNKDRDRDRELRSDRLDTPRATPRSTKIGETLSSVWGPGGSHSNAASPRHSAVPSPSIHPNEAPPFGSTTRGSSVAGDRPKSPWIDQQQQQQQHQLPPQTPGHQSTTSSRSIHSQQQKSPYVETISTTIEPPKVHSPWDTVPSALSRSISNASVAHSTAEKERMSSLWEDAPRSSYGEPPKTPWSSNLKTPSHGTQPLGNEESTVLLATGTPGDLLPPPQPPVENLSRSLSVSGKSPAGHGVPLDVDDAPPPGRDVTSGWGGITPRSINVTPAAAAASANLGDGGAWGGDNLTTPTQSAAKSTPGSKIPKRSRKNSVATPGTLASAKVASPAKSISGAFGSPGHGHGEETKNMLPEGASPNLLAGVPAIGVGHGYSAGHVSPGKQALSPLNQPAPGSWTDHPTESHHDMTAGNGGDFDWGMTGEGGHGGDGGDGAWDYGTGEHINADYAADAGAGDSWELNNSSHPAPTEANDTWGFNAAPTTPSATAPPPSASLAHPPDPPPIETQLKTPKSSGAKTPKSIGNKTPKTPAAEVTKTPVTESVASPVEVSTPTTPGASKKKKAKKGTAAAAAAAAEEEERKRKEEEAEAEAERERVRLAEEAEKERIAREIEEAEKQRIAAEAEAEAAAIAAKEKEAEVEAAAIAAKEAEAARIAKEEEERLLKEEEEKLTRELAEAEAEEARVHAEKEEKERKERDAKAAAAALNEQPTTTKGKKAKKGKKGAALNMWEDEEEKEKERLAAQAKEAEERAEKEKAEQEAKAREAEEKVKQEEAVRKQAEEAKAKVEQEAKEMAEEERLAEEARNAEQARVAEEAKKAEEAAKLQAEQEAQSFAPAKSKKGKKSWAKVGPLDFDDGEEKARAEEARLAKEKADQEAREKEEKEKAEREREKEKEKVEREREEKERAERERKEKEIEIAGKSKGVFGSSEQSGGDSGSTFNFGGGGGGWSGFGSSGGEAVATNEQDGGGSGSLFGLGGKGGGSWGIGAVSSWGAKAKSKAPSLKNTLGNSWGAGSTFGNNFGLNFGESETQPEEVKLANVTGQPTSKPASIFDQWGFSQEPALEMNLDLSGAPVETSDPLADFPPPLPSKPPSRPLSRTSSPPPNPIPPPNEINPIITATQQEHDEHGHEHGHEHTAEQLIENTTPDPAAEAPAEEGTAPGTPGEETPVANAEEEWGLPVKVKKKKGKAGTEPSTPTVEGGESTATGKKKKKKGK